VVNIQHKIKSLQKNFWTKPGWSNYQHFIKARPPCPGLKSESTLWYAKGARGIENSDNFVLNPPSIPPLAIIIRFSWQHLSQRGMPSEEPQSFANCRNRCTGNPFQLVAQSPPAEYCHN
jgi:hypothetical protein